ncbi:helix-turn-helix domain-containing protein [Nocardia flavorosea]|uniref:helix-turn-helix domain-containing protein n=1 Tax=Nocardia flavorosea TaxID=53429 RepID=UPI0018959FA7|nr:helix-turn-helix domain-containing protein [Nocardia flavorosea]MBF6351201.1 helix-turn-helix domain-containing protein [Nocardia flavorosea]
MTHNAYIVDSTNTQDVEEGEQVDYWVHIIDDYQCALTFEGGRRRTFRAHAERQRTSSYQLVAWRSDESRYRRSPRNIRHDPDHDYRLMFPARGALQLSTPDIDATFGTGWAAVAPMSEPFRLGQDATTVALGLTIPRNEVDRRLDSDRPIITGIDLRSGLGRVVREMITGLFTERHNLTGPQFDAICDRAVELLCLLETGDTPTERPHLAELEAGIRRYVREHADDPTLDGHAVAHALGWSLRQVQLALQQSGTTPRRLIKEERLARAMEYLRNPGYRDMTVTELAHRLGFSSVSAFSSSFRERYGRAPSSIRTES